MGCRGLYGAQGRVYRGSYDGCLERSAGNEDVYQGTDYRGATRYAQKH
jgi:hypothetical protein